MENVVDEVIEKSICVIRNNNKLLQANNLSLSQKMVVFENNLFIFDLICPIEESEDEKL